jgi:hypothetical protein
MTPTPFPFFVVAVGSMPLPFARCRSGVTKNTDVYGSGHVIDWKCLHWKAVSGGVKSEMRISLCQVGQSGVSGKA